MRITNNMMINRMMINMNKNLSRLDKKQMQVSTGKRIHVPSDDPVAISRSLKIKSDLSELEQFDRNVDDTISFLETSELAIKNVGEALQRLRELTVQASNGVLEDEDTAKLREEVSEIKNQIINLANTTYSGKYIFSGKKTDQKLLDEDGNYEIDLTDMFATTSVDDRISFEVGINEKIEINTLGFDIFDLNPSIAGGKGVAEDDAAGIISMIDNIMTNLTAGNTAALSQNIEDVDDYINLNLTARSEIGAKMNRMELVKERIADDKINYSNLQSQLEDADMGEVIMQLLNEENVYNASLSVGARIIQPTLLDFLR